MMEKVAIEEIIAPNIIRRHSRSCRRVNGGRCGCSPTYAVRLDVMVDGKRKRANRTFKTLREADKYLAESKVRRRQGTMDEAEQSLAVLIRVAIERLENGSFRKSRGGYVRKSTSRGYIGDFRKLLRYQWLAGKGLDLITNRDAQRLADELLSSGLSVKSAKKTVAPLRVIVREQVSYGVLSHNVFDSIRWPQEENRPKEEFPKPEDALQLIEELPVRSRAVCGLGLLAGLRMGEALALRQCDVRDGLVSVSRTWTQSGMQEPKTKTGMRTVPIVLQLEAILRDVIRDNADPEGLLVHKRGDEYSSLKPDTIYYEIDRAYPVEGHLLRLHKLRKVFVSVLQANRVPMKEAMSVSGHASERIHMQTYAQVLDPALSASRIAIQGAYRPPRLSHSEAESEAWEMWQDCLEEENEQMAVSAEVHGHGFTVRENPSDFPPH